MLRKPLALVGPPEMASTLAKRTRDLRLYKGLTRRTLAERAGVSPSSLKRFETTGKASLELVLKVAHALARLNEFGRLLEPPPARSISELERQSIAPARKRGRI